MNLVLDDSGSMFMDENDQAIDRWSFAKYSLEVFAAMMGPEDTLNVYRMSDFDGGSAAPTLELSGSESPAERVKLIHDMPMQAQRTPYATVESAIAGLQSSSVKDKWLVVLTDGQFQDANDELIDPAQVDADLKEFVAATTGAKVAYMAIGPDASALAPQSSDGVVVAEAASSDQLLGEMTQFSNRIFGRESISPQGSSWSPDIAMEQVVVFGQGPDVSLGAAQTSNGTVQPSSVVNVSWVNNPSFQKKKGVLVPVPNTDLEGQLATYDSIPKGAANFDIQGSPKSLDIFYKPKIDFGIVLKDKEGNRVEADKIVGGTYTLEYGFMDENCQIIQSDLLGKVDYSATVSQGGKVIAEDFKSGEQIDLSRGDVDLDVSAAYLGGATSSAHIALKVLQPAADTGFSGDKSEYLVSEMAEFPADSQGMQLTYYKVVNGVDQPFTAEEWDAISADALTATSASNIEFKVVKGDEIGQVFLLARAPGGDVFEATTGTIPVTVTESHIFDEQQIAATFDTEVTVVDDISGAARFQHWWATTGWKLLVALLLFILLLGYVFKRRFSKRMKRRPMISGTPKEFGMMEETANGRFQVNTLRRFLPFVANTATLKYVPAGVTGFTPMRLKAGKGKSMTVTNWQAIAKRNNTEINGVSLNEETNRAPSFGPTASIYANTTQMTYEMNPSA